jgi:hypothetical protein
VWDQVVDLATARSPCAPVFRIHLITHRLRHVAMFP